MKQVTIRPCQIHDGIFLQTVRKGFVFEADELHMHAVQIDDEDYKVNFKTAGEDELMEAEWKLPEARKFLKSEYGVTMKKGTKANVVKQILDARYRASDLAAATVPRS